MSPTPFEMIVILLVVATASALLILWILYINRKTVVNYIKSLSAPEPAVTEAVAPEKSIAPEIPRRSVQIVPPEIKVPSPRKSIQLSRKSVDVHSMESIDLDDEKKDTKEERRRSSHVLTIPVTPAVKGDEYIYV